jgi:alkaline phosphatase D
MKRPSDSYALRLLLIAAIVVGLSTNCVGEETLVPRNSTWSYFAGNDYPDPNWQQPAYNDDSWPAGPGILGYGESYITTTIPYGPNAADKYTTSCFRYTFDYSDDPAEAQKLTLTANYDDGFLVYLNGQEVARRSLPTGTITYGTLASSHESGLYETIDISGHLDLLLTGANVLAVEVHQTNSSSSDLAWDAELRVSSSPVNFMWSGAVTPTSARVKAKLVGELLVARLAVDTQPEFGTPLYSQLDTAFAANGLIVDFEIGALVPTTQYYYAIEANGNLDTELIGSFQTFPTGATSFAFGLACGAVTGSDHAVFQTINSREPLFFLHTGDFHYENIAVNDPQLFRDAYESVLNSPGQSQLYREHPLVYMWDDHDYGPNNSDSTAPGRVAARQTYQECVPHYPLAAGPGIVPIYQAFDVGRVRFIVTDCRSARSPYSNPDDRSKTMLGTEQKTWFKQQLLEARFEYPLIVWVNTLPWIGLTGDDGWYAYTEERIELANFIAENRITQFCMLSGDAHMLAIDDGSNSDYSDAGEAGFPVFHAAALDRSGSAKGGPYSHGAYPGSGQFGWMEVTDLDDSLVISWTGYNHLETVIVSYSFTVPGDVSPFCGDTDADGTVLLSDIVYLIQYIFAGGPEPFPPEAGDPDCSGVTNITDAIYLINYIFADGPAPCDPDGDGIPDC